MAIKTGREGAITGRDLELMRALAFCPMLDARQVMRLELPGPEYTNLPHLINEAREGRARLPEKGFENYERCRQTLYRLAKKGFLARYKPTPSTLTMWQLSSEGHKNVVHDRLWLENTYHIDLPYNDYKPDPSRTHHYKAVCDIFVAIQPLLTRLYGPLPNWKWWGERESFASFTVGGKQRSYRPDAEIVLGDEEMVFVLEHQTRFARKTDAEIYKKIEQHKDRLGHDRLLTGRYRILFSCDEQRDIDYAENAARSLGADVFADFPKTVIQHIRESATIHSRELVRARSRADERTNQQPQSNPAPAPTLSAQAAGSSFDTDLDDLEIAPF